jgi:hypothetical protein
MAGPESQPRFADGNLRPDALGPHRHQHHACAHRLRGLAGGQGAAEAASRCRQCAPEHGSTGHRDLDFARTLPRLYRDNPNAQSWFSDPEANKILALRNGSLQGGYFILAARALGLDCGPMGGFNHAGIDAEFFAGTQIRSNFLCNLGYGAPGGFRPRNERLGFDEACQIL